MVYWSELEQEPYDPEEFVERLAWRTTGAVGKDPPVTDARGAVLSPSSTSAAAAAATRVDDGALHLHDAFVEAIKDLTLMHETQKKKCEALEQVCCCC